MDMQDNKDPLHRKSALYDACVAGSSAGIGMDAQLPKQNPPACNHRHADGCGHNSYSSYMYNMYINWDNRCSLPTHPNVKRQGTGNPRTAIQISIN